MKNKILFSLTTFGKMIAFIEHTLLAAIRIFCLGSILFWFHYTEIVIIVSLTIGATYAGFFFKMSLSPWIWKYISITPSEKHILILKKRIEELLEDGGNYIDEVEDLKDYKETLSKIYEQKAAMTL